MEAKWGTMHKHEYYQTLHRGWQVVGWVVFLEQRWIARTADGSVRADFDTADEAKQFLIVIVSASEGESDG